MSKEQIRGRSKRNISAPKAKEILIPEWSTSCPDWEQRIVDGDSLVACKPIFPDVAKHAFKVFSRLNVVDAIGAPTLGSSLTQTDKDIIDCLFGSLDLTTGRRHIKEFFYLTPKKNGKSTRWAGVMLTALILNDRESADFLILAPTVDVADNAYIPLREMIRSNDDLSKLFRVQNHIRTVTNTVTGARLRVVAASSDSVSGKKATGILFDELWLFGKRSNCEEMMREAIGGLASRPEGFVVYLSSQSEESPSGVFRSRLDYARKVRDGHLKDNAFLPVIYEFPKKMLENKEYLNPENFYITNPYLGVSVDKEFLERELSKAKLEGGDMLNGFLSKHLSVEISVRLRSDRWAGADLWESCADTNITLDYIKEKADIITCGIDGGGLDDLYALAVIGRHRLTGVWMALTRACVNRKVLSLRPRIATQLKDFHEDKSLLIFDDPGDDIRYVVDIVKDIRKTGKLVQVGVDPHGIAQTVEALKEAGIRSGKVVGIPQGWKLVSAIKGVERRLSEKKFTHDGSPLLNWAVGNAKVREAGNAVNITKQDAANAKIDPLVAIFNAAACMGHASNATKPIAEYLRVSNGDHKKT